MPVGGCALNVLIRADDGSLIALTQREAEQRIEQLRERLQRLCAEKALIEAEVRALHPIAVPPDAYEAME